MLLIPRVVVSILRLAKEYSQLIPSFVLRDSEADRMTYDCVFGGKWQRFPLSLLRLQGELMRLLFVPLKVHLVSKQYLIYSLNQGSLTAIRNTSCTDCFLTATNWLPPIEVSSASLGSVIAFMVLYAGTPLILGLSLPISTAELGT